MNFQKKPACAAALLAGMFLLQNCATITKGTSRKVPVTSTPMGAKVIVDGKDKGTTPLTLKLRKARTHVIRIEKEGFNPHEIRIKRIGPPWYKTSLIWLGNSMLITPVAVPVSRALTKDIHSDDFFEAYFMAIVYTALVQAAMGGILTAADFTTGGPYSLKPDIIEIALSPAGETPRLEITELDAARLRDVKWLRIRAAGAGETAKAPAIS